MRLAIFLILVIFISGCSPKPIVRDVMEEPVVEKEIGIFLTGQDILLDGLNYKVDKVETYTEIGTTTVSQKADGLFYMVYLTVENVGKDEGYVFSPSIQMIDENEISHDQNLRVSFYIDNMIDWDKALFRGEINKGVVVFDLPEDIGDLRLKIKNDWTDISKAFVKIPKTAVAFKDVSEDVVKAREDDKFLRAGIN